MFKKYLRLSALSAGLLCFSSFEVCSSQQVQDVRMGRYLAYEPSASDEVLDYLSQQVSIKFGRNIMNVGDAVDALLVQSNYKLIAQESRPSYLNALLEQSISTSMRAFEYLPRRTIFDSLIGEGYFIVTDHVNKLISFEPYKATLSFYLGRKRKRDKETDLSLKQMQINDEKLADEIVQDELISINEAPKVGRISAAEPNDNLINDNVNKGGELPFGGVEIEAGTVNNNIIRIAEELGIPKKNVEFVFLPCELIEKYNYTIPPEKINNKYERLTFYASQYSFFTTFNTMTNTVTLEYRGPDIFDKCRNAG